MNYLIYLFVATSYSIEVHDARQLILKVSNVLQIIIMYIMIEYIIL